MKNNQGPSEKLLTPDWGQGVCKVRKYGRSKRITQQQQNHYGNGYHMKWLCGQGWQSLSNRMNKVP